MHSHLAQTAGTSTWFFKRIRYITDYRYKTVLNARNRRYEGSSIELRSLEMEQRMEKKKIGILTVPTRTTGRFVSGC